MRSWIALIVATLLLVAILDPPSNARCPPRSRLR